MLEVSVLDQVALNGLPPEIKIALVHAADLGDVNQMKKLVAQITSQNIELAQVPGGLGRCV